MNVPGGDVPNTNSIVSRTNTISWALMTCAGDLISLSPPKQNGNGSMAGHPFEEQFAKIKKASSTFDRNGDDTMLTKGSLGKNTLDYEL
ncbi:hypothetical protein GJ496_011353 [Pomphorhynchus laevis]|nr:hypothetical protein GJ496_011353 [Pomphorhynchus laevis]